MAADGASTRKPSDALAAVLGEAATMFDEQAGECVGIRRARLSLAREVSRKRQTLSVRLLRLFGLGGSEADAARIRLEAELHGERGRSYSDMAQRLRQCGDVGRWLLDKGFAFLLPGTLAATTRQMVRSVRREPVSVDDASGHARKAISMIESWQSAAVEWSEAAREGAIGAASEIEAAARDARDYVDTQSAAIRAKALQDLAVGQWGHDRAGITRFFLGVPGVDGMDKLKPYMDDVDLRQFDFDGQQKRDAVLAYEWRKRADRERARQAAERKSLGIPDEKLPDGMNEPLALAISQAGGKKLSQCLEWHTKPGHKPIRIVESRSGWFIDGKNAELVPPRFRSCLPLNATRDGRTALSSLPFAPIPWTARWRNMRMFFSPDDWASIGGMLNGLRGNRCCVCGRLRCYDSIHDRQVLLDEARKWPEWRHSPEALLDKTTRLPDIHEVWQFRDGVQTLVSLLPVCADCHAMWHMDHEEWNRKDLTKEQKADRKVYLLSERAVILDTPFRLSSVLAEWMVEVECVASKMWAGHTAEDDWVFDLAALQLLTSFNRPFTLSANCPVPVERIAGLPLLSQDGNTLHTARTVQQCRDYVASEREPAPTATATATPTESSAPTEPPTALHP